MGSSRKRKRRSGGEVHASPAKRKRSNAARSRPLTARNDSSLPSSSRNLQEESSQPSTSTENTNKRKHRPRSKQLCADVVLKITKALRSFPCPIGHLFKNADDDGMPYALLSEIVPILDLPPRILSFTENHLPLMSGSIYQVDLNPDRKLIVKYAPVEFSVEDATVYLDRLPYPCSPYLLGKLCAKYGTVVDARLPLRTPVVLSSARSATVLRRKKTRHLGFAFVQFSSKDEAGSMCKEFALNHPEAPHSRNRWFFNRGHRRHLGKHETKFAALTELRHARMLRLKLKLEKALCRKLKLRQWRKEWKEKKRKILRARRKQRKRLEKLRKAGKIVEEKTDITPKKSKQEKRKEANKRRRKRLSDLKKEAAQLLSGLKNGSPEGKKEQGNVSIDSSSECPMETSDGESPEKKKDSKSNGKNKTKKSGETLEVDQEKESKKRRRCRRKEITKSIRSHFIDVQAIPYREYRKMREEYLRLRDEAEKKGKEEMAEFRANKSNNKREEFKDAKWSLKDSES